MHKNSIIRTCQKSSRRELFLDSARAVLTGEISGIFVRESGSLRLFNAKQNLIYDGYSEKQEPLKGLICRLESNNLEIIAPCFSKFYNLGEESENDKKFFDLLGYEGAIIHFPEKIDGTNIRLYVNPDTGEIAAATRGMIDGGKDEEDGSIDQAAIHFGKEALTIARDKFPKILNKALLNRFTPVFELIHPDNRIVTNYGSLKDLVLLAVFDKDHDCREMNRIELEEFAQQYNLNLARALGVNSQNWDISIRQLHELWRGTDQEGVVVTVELHGEIVFRIKVKSPEYLALMRVMKFCTLKRTEELANAWNADSWDIFKDKLHGQYPDLTEEIVMGYEDHFRTIERYNTYLNDKFIEIVNEFRIFVDKNVTEATTQKEFAYMIKDRIDKTAFFLIRRFGLQNPDKFRPDIISALRKRIPLSNFTSS